MNERVWICLEMAKVSILPMYTLVQQTKIHPYRKYKLNPQRKPKMQG